MKFKVGDIVKVKDEILEKTKRQRSNGKAVDGKWIGWFIIENGRRGRKFEIAIAGHNNSFMSILREGGTKSSIGWQCNSIFELVDDVMEFAEDF